MKKRVGIFWFTYDLRLHDNPALMQAFSHVNELYCVYCSDLGGSELLAASDLPENAGKAKRAFQQQSLENLNEALTSDGQRLHIINGDAFQELADLIDALCPAVVFRSHTAGWFENQIWKHLESRYPHVEFYSEHTHTLFDLDDLPFSLADLPASFTKFKNAVKQCKPRKPLTTLERFPAFRKGQLSGFRMRSQCPIDSRFHGGETHGLRHLKAYFSSNKPASYKTVRNAIDGWDNSCKFSPWLANGSLSVREVVYFLFCYEEEIERNESTYWIYFELLWREYFQWYARKFQTRLFALSGIKGERPVDRFDPKEFTAWIQGITSYPIVNACMNELRETGYLSNRGRQIVASCFVNELSMDWRYGAAYFEQVLIDYDVASNWGNWQYMAGVGADSRGKRHFNLEKQTQQFDPDSRYIDFWTGTEKR